ncbi:MAG: isochorismatase [Candidatus Pacebacteria bacterium]|nr:isochorismatase [Candidatus Paceibacterota bacterium]
MKTTNSSQLPIPQHFNPQTVGMVYRVDYAALEPAALAWRRQHNLSLASQDAKTVSLLIVDAQNTFCIPDYELYVGGRSGTGAIDDNRRLAQFIYRNLGLITMIAPTMDTHTAMQIFHQDFFVNAKGEHPTPVVTNPPINSATIRSGEWQVNMEIAWSLSEDKSHAAVARQYNALKQFVLHYCEQLEKDGKFGLTVWPYHAMLGGIGHALVPAIEEACFFHNRARASQTRFEIKGGNPLTENYSILRPEVLADSRNNPIAQKNARFIRTLLTSDRVIIAGQAKSHCVAWTIQDLLNEIKAVDPELAKKVYLLEDCTSPVAVPNPAGGFFVDFTDDADKAFARFAQEGMHIVKSTDPVDAWPDFLN